MPTYEYACSSCGAEFEVEQSIKDPALTRCEKCGKDTAKRQISRGGGFILKGGGWYSDLYSSSGNKKDAPKADASSSSSDTSTSASGASDGSPNGGGSTTSTSTTPATTTSTSGSGGGSGSGSSST